MNEIYRRYDNGATIRFISEEAMYQKPARIIFEYAGSYLEIHAVRDVVHSREYSESMYPMVCTLVVFINPNDPKLNQGEALYAYDCGIKIRFLSERLIYPNQKACILFLWHDELLLEIEASLKHEWASYGAQVSIVCFRNVNDCLDESHEPWTP